jgi:hypothetical protein
MSADGKILGTDTLSGDAQTPYKTNQIEFEGYDFIEVTDNSQGEYSINEQNVLYIYEPVSPFAWLTTLAIILFFAAVIVVFVVLTYKKRKKELMAKMEIS